MQRKSGSRRSYSRKRTGWGRRCKDYLRQFVAFMFSNVGIIGLVIGYTIAGSFVFIAIEGPNYVSRVEEVVKLRNETAARLWETTCCEVNMFSEENWRNRVHVELVHFQQSIVEAVQSYGYEGEQMAGNRWSFSGAFLYSLTVITTIGYGNVAPRTEWGKLATILYAIAGMPLFLLYLSNIGDILAKSFKWSYAKCCLCRGCQRRRRLDALVSQQQKGMAGDWEAVETPPPPEEASEDSSIYDPQSVTVPVTLCLAIMVGYVYGGAVLFANWENWGLLDGAYFCFISLSTIGFGDIVPGDMIRHDEGIELRFIFCSMYLMLGMALIAMCFNLMQEEVVHKIRSCADTLRSLTPCTTSL